MFNPRPNDLMTHERLTLTWQYGIKLNWPKQPHTPWYPRQNVYSSTNISPYLLYFCKWMFFNSHWARLRCSSTSGFINTSLNFENWDWADRFTRVRYISVILFITFNYSPRSIYAQTVLLNTNLYAYLPERH